MNFARLGDVCRVERGISWKRGNEASEGIPALTIPNIQDRLVLGSLTHLQGLTASQVDRARVRAGHTVMVGSNGNRDRIGDSVFFAHDTDFVFASFLMGILPRSEEVHPRYVHYFLRSPQFRQQISGTTVGSTSLSNLRVTQLRAVHLPVPRLTDQLSIVAVLAAYDELIENNLRRIAILEEMAQALYREWFVDFRYPAAGSVEFVDSSVGPIPQGWEAVKIGDAFRVLGGATPSTKRPEFWEGGDVNWFTPSDLTRHAQMVISESARKITQAGLDSCSATLFPAGSVMMTSRATLCVTSICTETSCTNQGFITCLPNDRVSAFQIYFWVAENADRIIGLASGATFKEISRRVFREIHFLVAPQWVTGQFEGCVRPFVAMLSTLLAQNANLNSTRDRLLPRLISGDVDVSDLDIDTSWLAA